MWLWNIYSCFQWYKKFKNQPIDARVIVENKVTLFPGLGVDEVRMLLVRTSPKRWLKTPFATSQCSPINYLL